MRLYSTLVISPTNQIKAMTLHRTKREAMDVAKWAAKLAHHTGDRVVVAKQPLTPAVLKAKAVKPAD